jgi:hypothetical protein
MRSTHSLTPTEAGQIYYERACRVIDEAHDADLAARGANLCLTGRLRVSACITLARLHLIPRLPAFLAAHPLLSIELFLSDRPIDLIEEGIDIGLRYGPLRDSSLVARRASLRPRQSRGPTARWSRRSRGRGAGSGCSMRGYATVSELGDAENISKSYVSRICGSRCWRRTLLSPFRGAGGSGTTAGEFGATAATELEGTSRAFRLVNRRGESMPSADFILCLSAMPS